MNFKVQRYQPGHSLYSEVEYKGCKPVFGQIVDDIGFIHFTMERADTLIPEGTYKYCFYNSPKNGWVVLLKDVPGFSFIEHHVANYAYELKGCTAHGLSIDAKKSMLLNSKLALTPWFDKVVKASGKVLAGPVATIIDGDFGTITYEKFNLNV